MSVARFDERVIINSSSSRTEALPPSRRYSVESESSALSTSNGDPATSAASSDNRFMAQNIHAGALMAGRRRLITFPLVSEFVFGTHNAAFVQVMYEQYLRDPASVGEDWRQLFDNGKLAELPVIPTDRAEVLGREEKGEVPSAAPARTSPLSPLPSTFTPPPRPAPR